MNPNSLPPSSAPKLAIVVLGGTGLIGKKVVAQLRTAGHTVTAASPSSGVNAVTGAGLAAALTGAQVVVDVTNSPSFDDAPVMEFFRNSTTNLIQAARTAGVRHLVALSVVGTDRLQASGYFRAKLVQETLLRESGLPYTIVRATQFFEFVPFIAQAMTNGTTITLANVLMQPILSDDVAAAVAAHAVAAPRHGLAEIAGPEAIRMDELVRRLLQATRDPRTIVVDPALGYFGTPVDDRSLVPGAGAWLGTARFGDWLQRPAAQK